MKFFAWLKSLFTRKKDATEITQLPPQAKAPVPAPVEPPKPVWIDPVAEKQNQTLATVALEFAKTFLGVKEATGNNDGKTVNMFQEYVGGVAEHGASWCACFRSYCDGKIAEKLGIKPILPKTDSSTELYAFAKEHGLLLKFPIPGCIALERGSGGTAGKTHHHTCRVIAVNADGTFTSIDGNFSNMVCYPNPPHKTSNFDFVVCC